MTTWEFEQKGRDPETEAAMRAADIQVANHAAEIAQRAAPKGIVKAVKEFEEDIMPDPWDTNNLGTYIQRIDAIGPARRMLQSQGELSASFLGTRAEETRSGNAGNGLSKKDVIIFRRAARRSEILDKDALEEEFVEPTIRRVVRPAVRAYETTLVSQGKLVRKEARKKAQKAGARAENIVFDAASATSRQRPAVISDLGRFVTTYLSPDAVYSALRDLKSDLMGTSPVQARQEIFRSIASPGR